MKHMALSVKIVTACFYVMLALSASFAENVLTDGDFELSSANGTFPDSGHWTPAWLGSGGAVCTTTAGRSGNGLWQYTGANDSDWWSGPYQEMAAAEGKSYEGYAWIRSPSDQPWVSGTAARVRVVFLNASHSVLAMADSTALAAADSAWAKYEVMTGAAPAGTAFVRFVCYLAKPEGASGQSVVNVDDCYLAEVVLPSLRVSTHALGIPEADTDATFYIENRGSTSLVWAASANADWLSLSPTNGSVSTGSVVSVDVRIDRTGLTSNGCVQGTFDLDTNDGALTIRVFADMPSPSPPSAPAEVRCYGRLLRVRDREPDGSLSEPRHHVIKGAAWSPASIVTPGDPTSRRAEFGKWYVADIQLMKEMGVNTVSTYLDFGLDTNATNVLDNLYKNGIYAVINVDENGTADTNNVSVVVSAYRSHPAVLAWSFGVEWNINLFFGKHSTLSAAASAAEAMAQQIKLLDPEHPVVSSYGEINMPPDQPLSVTSNVVNDLCPSVDIWSLNVYRGSSLGALFQEWLSVSKKPMFVAEYGTDAYRTVSLDPVDGYEDEPMQSSFNQALWTEIAANLSANSYSNVALGGTVFSWCDEWWKVKAEDGGAPGVHDNLGFYTDWNPTAHPDSYANEEYFGIVAVDRRLRQAYGMFASAYASVAASNDADGDGLPDEWEYSIVDAIASDSVDHIADVELEADFDGDGVNNADEYTADTSPTNEWSYLHFTGISASNGVMGLRWSGGILATQYVDRCTFLGETGGSWQCWHTNLPPTDSEGVLEVIGTISTPNVFFRIRACR